MPVVVNRWESLRVGEMLRYRAGMTKKVRLRGGNDGYLISEQRQKSTYDH